MNIDLGLGNFNDVFENISEKELEIRLLEIDCSRIDCWVSIAGIYSILYTGKTERCFKWFIKVIRKVNFKQCIWTIKSD